MADLVQSFVGDTALRLLDNEFIRKMAWGSNWQRLSICVNHSAPTCVGVINPVYYIGLNQGTDNGVKSSASPEWVGAWVGDGTNWGFTGGPPGGITQGGTNPRAGYKIGASLTLTGSTSSNNYVPITFRDYWLVMIGQTATGYSVVVRTPAVVPPADTFGRPFEQIACNTESTGGSFAVNFATNRLLDSVSIYWSHATTGVELSEVLVIRQS